MQYKLHPLSVTSQVTAQPLVLVRHMLLKYNGRHELWTRAQVPDFYFMFINFVCVKHICCRTILLISITRLHVFTF